MGISLILGGSEPLPGWFGALMQWKLKLKWAFACVKEGGAIAKRAMPKCLRHLFRRGFPYYHWTLLFEQSVTLKGSLKLICAYGKEHRAPKKFIRGGRRRRRGRRSGVCRLLLASPPDNPDNRQTRWPDLNQGIHSRRDMISEPEPVYDIKHSIPTDKNLEAVLTNWFFILNDCFNVLILQSWKVD